MALLQPVWMQSTGGDPAVDYSALELRNLLSGLLRSEGILHKAGALGLQVVQRAAGANFSVDVGDGYAAIQGDDVTNQGMYLIRADGVTNVVTPSAPGSGTRVHRVVAQIRDKTHNGAWTTYEWTLDLLQDTGSGTPALPGSAIALARISIAAGQANVATANITDDRVDAALVPGQPRQIAQDSDRPANPFTSEIIWRTDKGCFEIWTGSAWREMHIAGGGPAWTTYTPSWTSTGTAPNLGNGTAFGRYVQIGKRVSFTAEITLGSTSTAGTGSYSISLPVTARTSAPQQYLNCRSFDASTSEQYMGQSGPVTSSTVPLYHLSSSANDSNPTTNTAPITLASGDMLTVFGTYEAA